MMVIFVVDLSMNGGLREYENWLNYRAYKYVSMVDCSADIDVYVRLNWP